MKIGLLGILFFVNHSLVIANSDYILIGKMENIVFTALPGNESFYENEIIAHLCNEYIKEYYPLEHLPPIYLVFGDDPLAQPILEYENLNGDSWNERIEVKEYRELGVRIKIYNSEYRTRTILKLLDYAINHLDTLKAQRNEFLYSKEKNRSKTLNEARIQKILNSPTSANIHEVMQLKVLRGLGRDVPQPIYYYQNDAFKFHNDKEVYLEINRLYQIINIPKVGHLIFETDFSFYFYNIHTQMLSKKYTLNSVNNLYKYDPFELLRYSRRTNQIKLKKGKDKIKLTF
ncbi:MAG: hypothetical protein R3C61_08275 [Bacteroidia bacterium]